jgi:CRP/FNR family transcriptional regulator
MDAVVNAERGFPSALPRIGCPHCGFTEWATAARLTPAESQYMDGHVVHNRRVRRYEHVHRSGTALATLDVINSGFLKSAVSGRDGSVQVTGFSMRGDTVGLDAIGSGVHQCDTIALEDAHLCGIEFMAFERLARDIPALQHQFHKAMGAEISRDYDIMLLLGAMRAEERVAIFLLNLSRRFAAHGCSAVKFRLPMQRQEIGNYLGLKLETVSRAFAHLRASEMVAIDGKDIEIKNLSRLRQSTQH